jgi:hypothetical protein
MRTASEVGLQFPKKAAQPVAIKRESSRRKYGGAVERKRLLDKWDKEVCALPK